MKKYLFIVAVVLIAICLLNCSDKPTQRVNKQQTNVNVSLLKSSIAQSVTRVAMRVVVSDQVVHQDTTTVNNGTFAFTSFELPSGTATFTVSGLDQSNSVIYQGVTTATIRSGQQNTVIIQLLPAVPVVKLTPYYASTTVGSQVVAKLELYNIAKFKGGTFRVSFNSDLIRSDSAHQSNQAWGTLTYNVSHVGNAVIIDLSRPLGTDTPPANTPALMDLYFTPVSAGLADLTLEAQRMVDNQGTIAEITNESLVIDNASVSITQTSAFGSIAVVVTDAIQNHPLDSVNLSLTGAATREGRTDITGEFAFTELPYGTYQVTASKSGYLNSLKTVTLDQPITAAILVMSDTVATNVYRAVLTWDSLPADLDAHVFTDIDSTQYEIYYSQRGSDTSLPWVFLDHDETQGFGPETMTFAKVLDTCRYAVYNYSGSPDITNSHAHVDLYKGQDLLRSYDIPTTGTGTWWYVFDLAPDGTIINQNLITDTNPIGTSSRAPDPPKLMRK